MSLLAMSLARMQVVGDPHAKFLLFLIADRHNGDTGECVVSISQLCAESELTRSTVSRKLGWLEAAGFITRHQRVNPDGGHAATHHDLLFVPLPVNPDTNRSPRRNVIPPEDWRPKPTTLKKLRQRYPHHKIDEDYLIREWIQFCHAKRQAYANLDAAFLNNAERQLRRQSAEPAVLRAGPGGQSRAAGSLATAVRDLLDDGRA